MCNCNIFLGEMLAFLEKVQGCQHVIWWECSFCESAGTNKKAKAATSQIPFCFWMIYGSYD